MNSVYPFTQTEPPQWNAQQVALSVPIAMLAQAAFLASGSPLMPVFALAFDALILIRAIVAWLLRERGRGWLLYALLSYSSVAWLPALEKVVSDFYG